MPREKALQVSALNVKTHPHSPEIYTRLFRAAYRARRRVRYYGDRYAIFGLLHPIDRDDHLLGLEGQIITFIDVDPEQPWLNIETGEQAKEDEMTGVDLLQRLKPSMRRHNFVFYPKEHRFVFESYSHEGKPLSPTSAQKIVHSLLLQASNQEDLGDIEVVVEPTQEALEKIWRIPTLRRLRFTINRPNADDGIEFEREVLKRLEKQGAEEHSEELVAQKGQSLQPDETTKKLAEVASHNGFVKASGKSEDGAPVSESTLLHPLKERVAYNPRLSSPSEVLKDAAREIVRRIVNG